MKTRIDEIDERHRLLFDPNIHPLTKGSAKDILAKEDIPYLLGALEQTRKMLEEARR
jgi:hypothetical protein